MAGIYTIYYSSKSIKNGIPRFIGQFVRIQFQFLKLYIYKIEFWKGNTLNLKNKTLDTGQNTLLVSNTFFTFVSESISPQQVEEQTWVYFHLAVCWTSGSRSRGWIYNL